MSYNKKSLAVGCHIPIMSRIYIEEEYSVWTVFSNGAGGEEKSLIGSIYGHSTQGITWFCLPANNKSLVVSILKICLLRLVMAYCLKLSEQN